MPDLNHNRRSVLAGVCACCAGAIAWPLAANAAPGAAASDGSPQALELGTAPMERIAATVWVAPIAPGVWLHSVTDVISGGLYYPANGLILENPEGALLIDTGYRPDQGETLLAWSRRTLAHPISLAVATHFHNDRTGGIPGLLKAGVRTMARPLTCELARAHGMPVPDPIAGFETGPYRLSGDCELLFPGPGHSRDNIVAWLPLQRVLFGGCLLKSSTSEGLGNIADSDIAAWPASVRRVRDRYQDAKIVVPGHGTISGDPIGTTLSLLAKRKGGAPAG